VAPATTVPADSPVQQQFDQGFETGFTDPVNRDQMARIAALALPSPQVGDGWPDLAPAYTPANWTTEFVEGLLDIDFAHQSRQALGPWLVAEEAPDLMPGIPPDAQRATLYSTVMGPAITGQAAIVPNPRLWAADAAAEVHWAAGGLAVTVDPQWQSIIAAGWQPKDLYASVLDVSGLLTVTRGSSHVVHHFSMVVQLGSAHWHPGYGTALVSGWTES
jgi:hypothetical protein